VKLESLAALCGGRAVVLTTTVIGVAALLRSAIVGNTVQVAPAGAPLHVSATFPEALLVVARFNSILAAWPATIVLAALRDGRAGRENAIAMSAPVPLNGMDSMCDGALLVMISAPVAPPS